MPLTNISNKTVSVIGLGYIGLPTAVAFAGCGIKVIGVDVDRHAVDTINGGGVHIVEPDLDIAVRKAVESGFLKATLQPEPADVFLIAVPTPFKGADHEPDLSYIQAASNSIAPFLKSGDLVVLESTSPVGATEQMAGWLAEKRPDLSFPMQKGESSDIRIAHCPERVLPGKVMTEIVTNDRIIGGMTPLCGMMAKAAYQVFVKGDCILTDVRTAELCKLAENSFRDVNIAYANELSLVCDKLGINVWELILLANRHPRVNILQPGAGVGGHCIAVDPWFIVSGAREQTRLISAARNVNDGKPDWIVGKVEKAKADLLRERPDYTPVVAVLGLAFKPNIDDLRESPALQIAIKLSQFQDIRLLAVEPYVESLPDELRNCALTTLNTALDEADIVVVLVKHDVFSMIPAASDKRMQCIIDAVGLFEGGLQPSRIAALSETLLSTE